MSHKSISNQSLEQWDAQHLWHAFTHMPSYQPFVIERADGCYLYDINGNRYLDAESSLWCNVHGHNHPKLNQAMIEQINRVAHVTLLGMTSDTTVKLAKQLCEVTPESLDHVFFSSDGACAVEVALKLAVQYWQNLEPGCPRTKFLCFDDAYHGDTLGTISVGGVDRFNRVFQPLLFETIRCPVPCTYHLPTGTTSSEACQVYLASVREQLSQHHHEIAGVVIEPLVQCAAGMVTQPSGFLKGLADLCREFETLLIADEIAVGFGRTGTLFACEQEGVIPDFLCLGKGLTGGYLPLSATMIHTKIWDSFLGPPSSNRVFCHGHTYGGNPIAAAVALASLKLFQEQDILRHVHDLSQQLNRRLDALRSHPHIGDIRQRGLVVGIELVQDRDQRTSFDPSRKVAQQVCQLATQRGVWLRPLQDVIVLMPPLAFDSLQIDTMVDVLHQALLEVLPA